MVRTLSSYSGRSTRYVTIGVDIGQKVDHSAVVVCEATHKETGKMIPIIRNDWYYGERPETAPSFEVRDMARLPLGTDFDVVGHKVANAIRFIRNRYSAAADIRILVDVTGLGNPVLQKSIMPALQDVPGGFHIVAATFNHGDRILGSPTFSNAITVGKAYLASNLKALFQSKRIAIPKNHPEAQQMMQEVLDYEIRVSENANDQYGAFKVGAHDDLVTAMGMAVLDHPADHQITIIRDFLK